VQNFAPIPIFRGSAVQVRKRGKLRPTLNPGRLESHTWNWAASAYGIVHNDIEATECLDGFPNQSNTVRFEPNVGLDHRGADSIALDFVGNVAGDLFRRVGVVVDNYVRLFCREF
jgi:hypothetical protein